MNINRRHFLTVAGAGFGGGLLVRPCDAETRATITPLEANGLERVDHIFIPGNADPLPTHNPDVTFYPASLTKLMTIALLFREIKTGAIRLDDKLPITRQAVNGVNSWWSGLKPGSFITVEQAIRLALGRSNNDVAYAIAQYVSGHEACRDRCKEAGFTPGTEHAFCQVLMKSLADELGMENSRFWNSSGLPAYDTDAPREWRKSIFDRTHFNVSTAGDMALLGHHILSEHPELLSFFCDPVIRVPGLKDMPNINPFTGENAAAYPGVRIVKTGVIGASGHNILALAQREEGLIGVVSTGHKSARARDDAARDLLEKGFALLRNERDMHLRTTPGAPWPGKEPCDRFHLWNQVCPASPLNKILNLPGLNGPA
jgi:D-alanyl-D-alanine carboxypeptidase